MIDKRKKANLPDNLSGSLVEEVRVETWLAQIRNDMQTLEGELRLTRLARIARGKRKK